MDAKSGPSGGRLRDGTRAGRRKGERGTRVERGREKGKKKESSEGMLDSFLKIIPGDDLLSHTVTHAVPSAPKSLTSEFGMGSGMASSISLPENFWLDAVY